MFEHEALKRRREMAVLEGIATRAITIKCSVDDCCIAQIGFVDEATTAKQAYEAGWRSEDVEGQEARGALCPTHAKEKGQR